MPGLDTFVVIDIETTGLDSATCGITELGAIRFENGRIAETFSQLVNPLIPIPPEISGLTGITDKMVSGAPTIDQVISNYQEFIGVSDWVVGHNIEFDLGFLKKYFDRNQSKIIDNCALDTAVLARILFPRLSRYGLSNLARTFDIKRENAHRAADDCKVTGNVYLELLRYLAGIPISSQKRIADSILLSEKSQKFLESIRSLDSEKPGEYAGEEYSDNITGDIPEESYDDYIPVDAAAIKNHFLNGGILSKALPSFEYRPQQAEMAIKVGEAFNRSEFLVVEAPTGVGKSLAYLLPASWWASLNNERVVISTQTKSLQAQLFYKDIPIIQRAVGYKFRAVLLKGRGNYICLYKYNELLVEASSSFNKRDREALSPLVLWVENTKTGDISECNGFNPSKNWYLWSRMSCEGGFCLGQSCPFAEKCFLLKERTSRVVVNHYLTFADFASGGDLVRETGHVIFDEAHNLEKVAATFLGNRLDKQSFDSLISDIYSSRPVKSGLLINIKAMITLYNLGGEIELFTDSIIELTIRSAQAANSYFEALGSNFQSGKRNDFRKEITFNQEDNPCLTREAEDFIESLQLLYDKTVIFVGDIRDLKEFRKKRDMVLRLESFAMDLKKYIDIACDTIYASNSDFVYWIEVPSNDRFTPKLNSAPLNVGELLDAKFYDYLKTAIFTSATLTVNNNFDYINNRLGLDQGQSERVETSALDSPFDIDSEVAVISAAYLPSPRDAGFEETAAESLRE